MGEIVQLWLGQLYRLTVLMPAWLLTPEGRATLFSRKMAWRIALGVAVGLAFYAFAMSLPADLALIAAGDLVSYAEIAALVWISAAAGLARGAFRALGRALRPRRWTAARQTRRAALRRRRQRRLPPPANDDGPSGERWTVAA